MVMTLTELAEKWMVDKFYFHSYMPQYETLMADRKVSNLLEIGIGYRDLMLPLVPEYIHGASLHMWSEFWPEAKIHGCDIRQDTMICEGNILTFVCDQSKPLDLLALVGEIGTTLDVIIDDGSHQKEHQFITAMTLLPYLAVGGIYVVEDVKNEHLDELCKLTGGMAIRGTRRDDDNLCVIRR